ncbi:MAG: DUF3458 domain-containing protein [Saprospiraceae bacterium]|nr:DUF3458 domain-containing protein [Saprospiraceae bacterium]
MKYLLSLVVILALLIGCKTQQKVITPPEDVTVATPEEEEIEERNLDTLTISATPLDEEASEEETEESHSLPVYNASHTHINDLVHTKLDLRFDMANEKVLGKATLKLKPYFYPTDKLTLDAKGFEFHKVTFEGKNDPLKYSYENDQITISLGRNYKKDEEYTIYIEYTASPNESGGSVAITSDKGLYFIDPRDEDPEKPTQIWTQGETEANSKWFPTIDKPNERCTEEIYVTVEDKYVTLSNGLLISSKKNNDGTRTDYWKMDQPHAPYLFMLAIGEYAVVKEKWQDISVEYYVEPKFKDHAKAIFAHTPEMLEFFSTKLGIKYPWKKYAQVVVRDYVSGAMENTTAVIFGEQIQKTSRELIDAGNDYVVAHELFHHWFGDYVTTESWANLTMNEGFANYAEYLWNEYKYGVDVADYNLLNEWNGYFSDAQGNAHPLIHFAYEDKENMFDGHSYNKGGSVLHMLRNYVGDDAFWASLNKYLKDNAYKAVEAHNLRLAFEEVTGQDLNWFFNQWYFSQGHPTLDIAYSYDETAKTASVTVKQTQSTEGGTPAIFQIPAKIDLYTADGNKTRHEVWIKEREETFTFEASEKPQNIIFDADRTLLCEKQEEKTEEEFIFQYRNGVKFMDRYEALQYLAYSESPTSKVIFKEALKDKLWWFRAVAINYIENNTDEEVMKTLREMAANDPNSQVRASALEKLIEFEDTQAIAAAQKAVEKDSSTVVIASGLYLLNMLDSAAALVVAQKFEKDENGDILAAVSSIYGQSKDPKYLAFFEKNFSNIDGYAALNFMEGYQNLIVSTDFNTAMAAIEKLKNVALDMDQSQFQRLGATYALNLVRKNYYQQSKEETDEARKKTLIENVDKMTQMIEEIKSVEQDAQLQNLYEQLTLEDE